MEKEEEAEEEEEEDRRKRTEHPRFLLRFFSDLVSQFMSDHFSYGLLVQQRGYALLVQKDFLQVGDQTPVLHGSDFWVQVQDSDLV